MSCYIPFEIQTEILKHVLPVKSLIRFMSVYKQWKSLIDSSEFITRHALNNTHPHHLLIRYTVSSEEKYVSIVDDDCFRQQKFSHIVPPKISTPDLHVLACSHGLVCLRELPRESNEFIVIWNPSIRKTVRIAPPSRTNVVGFGVCPKTYDPKIVSITLGMHAHVFTLSTRAWRSVPMNLSNTSSYEFYYSHNQVVIDGVIHCKVNVMNDNSRQRIIAFDLTSEEFGEVALPDSLAGLRRCAGHVRISRLKESLAVIAYYNNDEGVRICDVWLMLKNGVSESSLTKLFTIAVTDMPFCRVIGFRKNGQPVIDLSTFSSEKELQVYDPDSYNMNGLGIYGLHFNMVNLTESLLLLNYSDSIIQ